MALLAPDGLRRGVRGNHSPALFSRGEVARVVTRSLVLVFFHAWCAVGVYVLSALVVFPAAAGTNEWTRVSGNDPNVTCDQDGVPSAQDALACHGMATYGGFPLCTLSITASNYGTNPRTLTTRRQYDMSAPQDCAAGLTNASTDWSFGNQCSTIGKQWDSTYAGCAEVCVAPDTLNTTTGLCEAPPDCSLFEGTQVDRFFPDATVGGDICASPPGDEVTGCEALVASPTGMAACAGGECFARVVFTGDQCGGEPDATGEDLVDEPGDMNCVSGDGVTVCAAQDSQNCGTVNGETVCLNGIPPGRCTFLGDGGMVCASSASAPPAPTEMDGMTPATPDGTFSARGDDEAEQDFDYFGPGAVQASGSATSGTSQTGSLDEGSEEGGACEEEGSCPGVLPELGETSTIAEATGAFLDAIEASPIVSAATSIGASWPVGECPAPSVTIGVLGDVELTLDAHCTMWVEWGAVLATVLLAFFVFLGVRIVLSA